jgi:hypothetical protein
MSGSVGAVLASLTLLDWICRNRDQDTSEIASPTNRAYRSLVGLALPRCRGPSGCCVFRHSICVFGPSLQTEQGRHVMTTADLDHGLEEAEPTEPLNATRYSLVNTSPSAIVKVTGPRPDPVLTNDAFTGPNRCAAAFIGKTSGVSVMGESSLTAEPQ